MCCWMKSPQSSSLLQAPVKWACPVKLKMKHQNKDLVTPSSSSFSCSSIKAKGKKEKKVFVSNPQKQPQSADMFCCIGSPFEKWSLRITHWSFTANWLWPRRSPLLLCGNLCNNVLNSTYRYSSSSNSNDSSIESCIGSASNNNSYCSSTFVSE